MGGVQTPPPPPPPAGGGKSRCPAGRGLMNYFNIEVRNKKRRKWQKLIFLLVYTSLCQLVA